MSRSRKSKSKRGQKIVATATPGSWEVMWHPNARDEMRAIDDAKERVAIAHVIEKLKVDGPALRSPHQSAVMGDEGSGLRELRPRRGRSRWRPIYRRIEEMLFAILSIGPEAESTRPATAGLCELLGNGSGDWKKGRRRSSLGSDYKLVIGRDWTMADQLISHEEVLEENLRDPKFREEWERTAVARWLAVEVAHYRAEHRLSQRQLAERLEVHQSDVARMETGEHTPTLDRLIRIAKGLDIELMIDIRPQKRAAKLPKKQALEAGSFELGGCEVVFATA